MVKSYYFIDKNFHKKLVDYKLVENEPTFLKTILWTWVSFDMAFLRVILDRLLFHLLINVGLSIMCIENQASPRLKQSTDLLFLRKDSVSQLS